MTPMPSNDAVHAVAAALDVREVINQAIRSVEPWSCAGFGALIDAQTEAVHTALAALAPDDVVRLVDELIDTAIDYGDMADETVAARTALLAMGPGRGQSESTTPIVETHTPIIDEDYGNGWTEHRVSVGNWHSYTSDGTLVLKWGDAKKNIWCPTDRGELADLIKLYQRQIEIADEEEAALGAGQEVKGDEQSND